MNVRVWTVLSPLQIYIKLISLERKALRKNFKSHNIVLVFR